ncbi:MAG: hypothetical protein AB7O26_08380 [Planctomycetaceae bacterium]
MNRTGHEFETARLISSRMTFFNKRVFPTFWFGSAFLMLVGVIAHLVLQGQNANPDAFVLVAAPIGMSVFGYFLMTFLVWDLMDEVWDCGDVLIVRNRGVEFEIPLTDCRTINWSVMQNPGRITLFLRTETPFGKQLPFMYPASFNPFAAFRSPPIALELLERIEDARESAIERSTGSVSPP